MKKKKRLIIIMAMFMLTIVEFLSGLFDNQLKGHTVLAAEKESVEKVFDDGINEVMNAEHATGATAIMIREGKVTLEKGYGYSNKELKETVDTKNSGFRIGSNSKTFVAIAALAAVEEGKLDLNADITTYLENDFPKFQYPITMEQLLTHTAGFEDQITGIVVRDLKDMEPLSTSVRKYKPAQIFKPGEVISYSNYGVALAAYVIEKATGEDFANYCNEKIFLPLGMSNTSYKYDNNKSTYSKAYLPNGKEAFEPYINIYAEGSVITTAEDMGKYIQWLISDQELIITNKSKNELFRRHFTMSDELNGIGYIWNIKSRNGENYYEKKGETVNFYSRVVLYPNQKAALFLTFNTYVPEEKINNITAKVTDVLLGDKEIPVASQGATIKMEGSYINTFSSFNTAEKIISYINPEKRIEITGSLSKGYKLNGKPIVHIGNNTYDTPIGTIKIIEKDGNTLLATNFSQTFIKIDLCESYKVTIFVIVLFLLSLIISFVWVVLRLIRKKNMDKILLATNIAQLVTFILLCAVFVIGLLNYAILIYSLLIQILSWGFILATSISLIYLRLFTGKKEGNRAMKVLYIHYIISISFCFVLSHMQFL